MNLLEYFEQTANGLVDITLFSVFIRIGLSLVIGGILGAERSLRNRPAGFVTYALVCMGSCIIMLTNIFLTNQFPNSDPARLGAQVVSGIGFLGAGTIILTRKDEIRGLTTAAGLWVAAGLGLAAGSGFYTGAIVGCLLYVFAVLLLRKIEVYFKQHSDNMEIYLEYSSSFSLRAMSQFAHSKGYCVHDMQRNTIATLDNKIGAMSFSLSLEGNICHRTVLESFYSIDGIEYVQEIS